MISRVGVPQYEEARSGSAASSAANITQTGLLPAVLDGPVNPGTVFDWTVQPGGHAEGLRGNGRVHTGTPLTPAAPHGTVGQEGRGGC